MEEDTEDRDISEMEIDEVEVSESDWSDSEADTSSALVIHHSDLRTLDIHQGEDDMSEDENGIVDTVSPKRKKKRPPSPPRSTISRVSSKLQPSASKRSSKSRRERKFHQLAPLEPEEVELNTPPSSSPLPGPSSSSQTAMDIEKTPARPLPSSLIDPEEEIRKATESYLQGEMSATEFAATMDYFEKYKAQAEAAERASQPSLILLDPDHLGREGPEGQKDDDKDVQEDVEDAIHIVPEVNLTEQDSDEEDARIEAKLRGEFFRTGDDTATFSIRKKRKMPPTMKNMMGEAHVRYARGDLAGAESICLEVIKEQPTYKDPFHTLAMIYESQGKTARALQFFLITGLLEPKQFDDWPRLAELSMDEGNVPQAIMCLRKAILCDPSNFKTHMRRSQLMTETGDHKGALRGYHKALNMADIEGPAYMDLAKKIAGIHFKSNELDQAYDVLMGAVTKFSDHVTTEEMNLLAEVCISLKRYVKAVTLFMRYSGVRFDPSIPKSSFKERSTLTNALNEPKRKCIVPIGLHADLVQKLCVILIHLEGFAMIKPTVTRLRDSEPLDIFGIQLYEIAEAYLAKQQYASSLEILVILVNTENYNTAAEIWLRYAECLFLLNRVEESAEAYSKVISLAPGHKIARLNLSVILQKLGQFDVALESLDQHETEDLMDQDLLVEKCNILFTRNRTAEFFETAMQLFSKHCPEIRNYDEAHALVITSQTNQMLQGLRSLRIRKLEVPDDDINRIDTKPTDNALGEWNVYLNLYRLLLSLNRPDLLNRLVYTVWASPLFGKDERMKQDLDLQAAFASIMNSDAELSPIHIRSLISTFGLSSIILRLVSLASRRCGHTRYGRQLVRLLMKRPTDTRLMMLSAHNSFMNGTYKYALMEYFALLQRRPKDPLLHLMIATTLLHISGQKATSNRSQLAMQAIAFINQYAELRGESQETFYNLGRFYHYIGLFRQALAYYKRVLITEPIDDRSNPDYNISDLRREAACNIAQIYKSANCWQLAKRYIYRYCVI